MKNLLTSLLIGLMAVTASAAPAPLVESQDQILNNLLTNPGFENGKIGWTGNKIGLTNLDRIENSLIPNTQTVGYGNRSFTWAASTSLNAIQQQVFVPKSLRGTRGFARLSGNTAATNYFLRVLSGSNLAASTAIAAGSSTFIYDGVNFVFDPNASTATFQVQANAASPGAITLDNMYLGASTSQPGDTVSADFSAWYVYASIVGTTNFQGDLSNSTSFASMNDSGITVTAIGNSQPVGAACLTGASSVSSGTCSVNEVIGGVFNVPVAGTYEACIHFNHKFKNKATNGQFSGATFRLQEDSVTSGGTPVQNGVLYVSHGSDDTSAAADAQDVRGMQHVCDLFTFSSAGAHKIILQEIMTSTADPVLDNRFLIGQSTDCSAADRACGSNGAYMTVRPW